MPGVFLVRSVGHIHKRVTDHLNVAYYVADTFSEEYTGSSLKTVERNVEDDYIANLRNNCWKEKQQSECAHACVCMCVQRSVCREVGCVGWRPTPCFLPCPSTFSSQGGI